MKTFQEYYDSLKHAEHTAFARRLGVTYATLRYWYTGKTTPRFPMMLQIERETGGVVPLDSWRNGR